MRLAVISGRGIPTTPTMHSSGGEGRQPPHRWRRGARAAGAMGTAPGANSAPLHSLAGPAEEVLRGTYRITARTSVSARGPDRLAQRAHRGQHGRGLVAAVRHAVGAARVLAPPVGIPVGGLDEFG